MARCRCFFKLALLFASLSSVPLALAEIQVVGKNTVQARKLLEARIKAGSGSSDAEKVEWARSVAALAFLERLEGNEQEFRNAWKECGKDCRKHLPTQEVRLLDSWKK